MFRTLKTADVFGINSQVRPESYVDRGELDRNIQLLLGRDTHIALRGESKCGKSWLRQKNIPNALVVQCRLGRTAVDLYVDALSQLDVQFIVHETKSGKVEGRVEAKGSIGEGLISKVFGIGGSLSASGTGARETTKDEEPVGRNINNLRYIADLIRESGRRLVIEDFHYLSLDERQRLSFDLKALWDYQLYVLIVGVWSQSNMLIFLNPDLAGRIEELSIYWSDDDLTRILEKGGQSLNLTFHKEFSEMCVGLSYGNAGILQSLVLRALDALAITEAPDQPTEVSGQEALQEAALQYADQLNPLYQQFARRVAGGIRTRQDSTGIYAHAMAVIMACSDENCIRGVSLDHIYQLAHARESRIQKGNLRTILEKLEGLQVDGDGRGLVVSYNEANSEVCVVDRQLLLYRRFCTVSWPWEELIGEVQADS